MHVILLRVAESGFAGYEDYTWIAFFAPAGTPRAVVRKLNSDVAAIAAPRYERAPGRPGI